MRHHQRQHKDDLAVVRTPTNLRMVLKTLWQYLSDWRYRIALALSCLILAKIANVLIPVVLKHVVDSLAEKPQSLPINSIWFSTPFWFVVLYGLCRLASSVFTELREIVFAKVTQGTMRHIALTAFSHLHQLSLRFHLDRQTGGVARDIERGTKALSSLVSYALYSILPTLFEITLVLLYLLFNYDVWFAVIVGVALIFYIGFTILVTEWRTQHRRLMNRLDSVANTHAIDALLNYETVKYFANEAYEEHRYDHHLASWEKAALKSQYSLSLLNIGQSLVIAGAVTAVLWRASMLVEQHQMTLGDLVLVNGFMLQLYMPLNFLGVLYREIRQSLNDLDRLFALLAEVPDIQDKPDAAPYQKQGGAIAFNHVAFSYDAARPIFNEVSFSIPAGTTVAIVGHSGAGKSTVARLLFRFYDVNGGSIQIDGQDIRNMTQTSLRQAIGIVPQDCVLFNESIYYNIAYADPNASKSAVIEAAKSAQIHDFIMSLPEQYEAKVGERGLKLSGGEKQRVAIARALLKQPEIFVFDEATSALDSQAERLIQAQLEQLSHQRTTIIIAHRLSTVLHADQILVFDQGQIVEAGRHTDLLAKHGLYAKMWAQQIAKPIL